LKKSYLLLFYSIFAVFIHFSAVAQISEQGTPPSIEYSGSLSHHPVVTVPPPDIELLKSEDGFYQKNAIAYRFAESIPVKIDFAKEGLWESLPDGRRICRLSIKSPGAQALILYYSRFKIPAGGNLFLYSADKKQIIGAFSSNTNSADKSFATEMIKGEEVILEYSEPFALSVKPQIVINEVGYVYRTADRFFNMRGFGTSDTCEVNVNCPEGEEWQYQKNGVVRIIVKSGFSSFWCSGSIVNNARNDCTPFLLTADHCGPHASEENYDQWVFYFRYEGDDCDDPESDSTFKSYTIVGAKKLAGNGGAAGKASDFKLLKLNENIPVTYNPFYNGWSIANEPSPSGTSIHHPDGDIKKISTYTDTLKSSNWGTIPNTHWRVIWAQTETNWGVTEGGSSGSPLFDNNGRIIGQLTGGEASCKYVYKPDYYGKFSYSWDGVPTADSTMLKPWLDPDDTGITEIDGIVSINEPIKRSSALYLYPNPAEEAIYIRDERITGNPVQVIITNLHGQEVLIEHFPERADNMINLNVNTLKKGIYIVYIIINDELRTAKLIR
jgi:hypothetical protein